MTTFTLCDNDLYNIVLMIKICYLPEQGRVYSIQQVVIFPKSQVFTLCYHSLSDFKPFIQCRTRRPSKDQPNMKNTLACYFDVIKQSPLMPYSFHWKSFHPNNYYLLTLEALLPRHMVLLNLEYNLCCDQAYLLMSICMLAFCWF